MKLVHAADLHLDSPLTGLERYEGAPVDQIRGATRRALENLVDLCLKEDAAVLLLAGDLYDGNWKDYSTGLFFAKQMVRLRQSGVRVVLVRGNHDAASQITKNLTLPDNVRELPSSRPATVIFEDLGLAIHGQSFATRAVTDDLGSRYPEPVRDLLNVGLLHTCASGRPGHEPYAPCSLQTMISKGYDYWALGHVHQREVLAEHPWVVFPGNLQGRQVRESGPKGATVVTIEDARITDVVHQPLDVVRWITCDVDLTDAADGDDVVQIVRQRLEEASNGADGRTLAARLVLNGRTRAHSSLVSDWEQYESEIRNAAIDIADDALWIERIRLTTATPVDLHRLAEREDAIGQVVRSLLELRDHPEGRGELLSELADLRSKLPAEVREGPDAIRLDDPALVDEMLGDIEQLVVARLLATGDDE